MGVYVVFSDVHNDFEILKKIPRGYDGYICLGDIIGGTLDHAKRTIDGLHELGAICVYGGHDHAVVDDYWINKWKQWEKDNQGVNRPQTAKRMREFYEKALHLRRTIPGDYLNFLKTLPRSYEFEAENKKIIAAHSNIFGTGRLEKDDRLSTSEEAEDVFNNREFATFSIFLVGHSHVPCAYSGINGCVDETVFNDSGHIDLSGRVILNPGSIQRNGRRPGTSNRFTARDSRSYGLLDTDCGIFEVVFV